MAQFLSTAAHNLQTLGKHPVQENILSAANSDERKKKEKKNDPQKSYCMSTALSRKLKRKVKDIFVLLFSVLAVRQVWRIDHSLRRKKKNNKKNKLTFTTDE